MDTIIKIFLAILIFGVIFGIIGPFVGMYILFRAAASENEKSLNN